MTIKQIIQRPERQYVENDPVDRFNEQVAERINELTSYLLPGAKYYASPSETDHGAASKGTNQTVYDIAQTVGTSKTATMVFRHTGEANTTLYTLDTSLNLSLYPNLYFYFEPGAILNRTTGDEILTAYSPENIICSKSQKITSVDMIAFGVPGKVYSELWGAKADSGTVNNLNPINYAISALISAGGGKLQFLSGTYQFSGGDIEIIDDDTPIEISGNGWATILYNADAGSSPSITIGSDDYNDNEGNMYIEIHDLHLKGNSLSGHGFNLLNAREVTIKKCKITDHGGDGIYNNDGWANHFIRNRIQNNEGHGINLYSEGNAVRILHNDITGHNNTGKAGIYIYGGSRTSIQNNDIEGNTNGVILDPTEAINNISIEENFFEGNTNGVVLQNNSGKQNFYGATINGNFFYEDNIIIGNDNTGTSIYGVVCKGNYINNSTLTTIDGEKIKNAEIGPNVLASGASYNFGDQTIMLTDLPAAEVMLRYTASAEFPYGTANAGVPGDIRWDSGKAAICTATQQWRFFQTQKISDLESSPLAQSLPTGATPSTAGLKTCLTANTVATNVTSLTNGYPTKELIVIGNDGGNTTFVDDGSYLNLTGGNFTLGDDDVLYLVTKNGTHWQEVSRANN